MHCVYCLCFVVLKKQLIMEVSNFRLLVLLKLLEAVSTDYFLFCIFFLQFPCSVFQFSVSLIFPCYTKCDHDSTKNRQNNLTAFSKNFSLGDQDLNIKQAETSGYAKFFEILDLKEENLEKAIGEMLNSTS